MASIKSGGSRRSVDSHNAIIEATVELLGTTGNVNFTIERIAANAGVGKQTIYRWWDSKADLVLEVWRDRLLPPVPEYDGSTSLKKYLTKTLLEFGKHIGQTDCRQAAICILSETHRDPSLHARMESDVYFPRIELIIAAFKLAEANGEFPHPRDISILIDQLYGAVWYKVMIRFEKVDATFTRKLVNQVFAGLEAE